MFNQKGQAIIIVLVLAVLGFILYANFSGSEAIKNWLGSYKINPIKKTQITVPSPQTPASIPAQTPASTPIISAPVSPVTPDAISPKRFNAQPKSSILPPETRRITLGLETDEKATCKYSEVAGISYNSMQKFFDQASATSHSALITTLSEGGKYKYYVRCIDEAGNANVDDFTVSFEVKLPEDKTPPVLASPSHQGSLLPKDTKEAIISISTNEPASCSYSGSMSGSFSYYDQTKKFHVKTITGLQNGKSYDFFVRCRDSAGNANTGDVLISFSISN